MQNQNQRQSPACIGGPRLFQDLFAAVGMPVEVVALDPGRDGAERLEDTASVLLLDPSDAQWASLHRPWISRMVSWVINGGRMLAFRGAFRGPRYPELVQMLGARIEYAMPYGEIFLHPVRPTDAEEAEGGKYALFTSPAIPRQDVFVPLQPLVRFQYGALRYPAVWRHAWGRGCVFCTTLRAQDFLSPSAGGMLQNVLRACLDGAATN